MVTPDCCQSDEDSCLPSAGEWMKLCPPSTEQMQFIAYHVTRTNLMLPFLSWMFLSRDYSCQGSIDGRTYRSDRGKGHHTAPDFVRWLRKSLIAIAEVKGQPPWNFCINIYDSKILLPLISDSLKEKPLTKKIIILEKCLKQPFYFSVPLEKLEELFLLAWSRTVHL